MNVTMPFDRKEYYQKNKSKILEQRKEYRKKNKEKIKEYKKEYMKEYNQTPAGKKSHRIYDWKKYGVIHHNFDELYEKYINTELCELCECTLTEDKKTTSTTRCLDHCHETGQFRNILCHSCNVKLPRQKS